MELRLIRKYKKETYTIGNLYINGNKFCDTLEDEVRNLQTEKKIPGKTAIPHGTYKIILTKSTRFKKVLPLLLNVPYFEGIRIHSGNTSKDTEGCILVGRNTQPATVTESKATMNELMKILTTAKNSGEEIYITIEE